MRPKLASPPASMPRTAFYVLFTASGFAGLIYESIWTQYLKLFLGHAAYAQSLVLAVFMGGMAAGAAWCARASLRLANPLAAYALVEALIGVLALVFHPVFVAATDWSYERLLPALGGEWLALGAKLFVSCLLILPQSILLGMTFPLMSAGLARADTARSGESVAMLYFTNSLGAAASVLASGFVLIAWVGLPGTLRSAAFLNLGIAALVWLLARPSTHLALKAQNSVSAARLLLAIAFFTGLASFIYEIAWIRMLSLVLGASTHSFELMLAAFILGLALGGLAVRRRIDANEAPERLLAAVQIAMGLAALATLPLYNSTFALMEALIKGLARNDAGYVLFNLSGAGIAVLVMLPATFCAGMTLPLLTGALMRRGAGEAAIGQVYAANTLGAIAGVMLAVHFGLPVLGLKGTLIAGSLIDTALGLLLLYVFFSKARLRFAAAACVAVFLAVSLGVKLDANKMTAGVYRHGELAASREATVLFGADGKTATVHLVKYPEATSLRTNGKSDGSINLDGADPRGAILIDDAKSLFSLHARRYPLIISEPSNPWVSGVSSLFTREFYHRVHAHLQPGGMLAQWIQLYEIDASLVASVMRALGEEFPHYAVFAPSDHDLLIIAADAPLPLPPRAEVFEEPGVAKELWTGHVLTARDP